MGLHDEERYKSKSDDELQATTRNDSASNARSDSFVPVKIRCLKRGASIRNEAIS